MVKRRRTPKQAEYDPRTVTQNIVDTPLKDEMSTSFLAYAYSVIYSRALPDARDGLKPVQRRIIYQMGQMHLDPSKAYMKSARVVGEVMGKLHPHGDSAIYEAMVRLAQDFAMRLPLVDGHGNFGSPDDGPAASRYTEARLASAALGMNADIDEGTVPFSPNYDNKLKEPDVLPAAIPNLLVNGSTGIAVGMATNMITHNLGEVIAAAKYLMRHPDASLDELMRFIPGPDLPGGGIIVGRDGIREAYETGKGSFVTRARTHVENVTARKKSIVVTELPYMIGPEKVLERIGAAVKDKKLDGITNAVDLSDRHNGLKLVITLKSGYDPQAVLAQLFKRTPMEDSFTINNVALVDGRPHTLGLKPLLQVWIDHRRTVVRKRSEFRKKKAEERLHLVEGLLLALIDIDEVIQVIRSSENQESARTRLMAVFDLDDIQAKYILDLQLRRLTKMSRIELEAEQDELKKKIAQLEELIASPEKLDNEIIVEMDEAARKWADPRRTVILESDGTVAAQEGAMIGAPDDVAAAAAPEPAAKSASLGLSASILGSGSNGSTTAADLADARVKDEPCSVVLSATGLIGRMPPSAADILATRAVSGPRSSDDAIASLIPTSTLSTFGLVTSAGRLVLSHAVDLPQLAVTESLSVSGGIRADELLTDTRSTAPIDGEHVIAAIALDDQRPLALGTRLGIVKRWNRESPTTMDSWSVISLKDGDAVIGAAPAADEDRLTFIASDASLLTFPAAEVRPQGRASTGMAGIKLKDGCSAIAFGITPAGTIAWSRPEDDDTNAGAAPEASGAVVLTIAGDSSALPGLEAGSAKLTPLALYPTKGRATRGVRAQRFLKGQDSLIAAHIGAYPLHAASQSGEPVALPNVDMRRDGSGVELETPVAYVG